jgi:entericidin A
MNIIVKKLAGLTLVTMLLLGISGCATMEGFGKDLSDLGEKIEKKAKE